MNVPERYAPLLFLLMWSSGAIFVKLGLEDASVSVFLTVRAIGATLALGVVCAVIVQRTNMRTLLVLPRPLLLRAMVIGLLIQVGYQAAYFLALDHQLTPGVLAIILGLQPILTPALARERLERASCCYLGLGLAGLIIAILGAREVGAVTAIGVLFGLVSVLAISAGSVMQKRSVIHPIASAFYQTLTASCVFVLALPFTQLALNVTPQFLVAATWMILIVSTCAVLLLFYMLSRKAASQVGVLFYLVPVVTVVLDYIVFGNTISWVTLFGALVIVVAVRRFSQVHCRK
ncbi:DMT family transporter [Pseudomonas sp.]|uniref:DMT family transporter n=1 Tax=Pseudomonas sp. TaxID=306 RepID=UPI0028AFAE75|nr:DMT family transporter [Pseudomonas sp.]